MQFLVINDSLCLDQGATIGTFTWGKAVALASIRNIQSYFVSSARIFDVAFQEGFRTVSVVT